MDTRDTARGTDSVSTDTLAGVDRPTTACDGVNGTESTIEEPRDGVDAKTLN